MAEEIKALETKRLLLCVTNCRMADNMTGYLNALVALGSVDLDFSAVKPEDEYWPE